MLRVNVDSEGEAVWDNCCIVSGVLVLCIS